MVHVVLDTQVIKINSVYVNLKDQMKLDLCICEGIGTVPWKPHLWAWQSMTTNINYVNKSSKAEQKMMIALYQNLLY